MKKFIAVLLALVFVFSIAACQNETEAPLSQPGQGSLPADHPAAGSGQISVPQERQVVVPADVKSRYKAISINVEDKASGNVTSQDITLGGEFVIPGSNIKVIAGEFLPDFIMEGAVITSRSAEPNNPAARITVLEGDAEIFDSWIYSNHPAIHPFQHEKYGITLRGGK